VRANDRASFESWRWVDDDRTIAEDGVLQPDVRAVIDNIRGTAIVVVPITEWTLDGLAQCC
jgi:hypothetical protein